MITCHPAALIYCAAKKMWHEIRAANRPLVFLTLQEAVIQNVLTVHAER